MSLQKIEISNFWPNLPMFWWSVFLVWEINKFSYLILIDSVQYLRQHLELISNLQRFFYLNQYLENFHFLYHHHYHHYLILIKKLMVVYTYLKNLFAESKIHSLKFNSVIWLQNEIFLLIVYLEYIKFQIFFVEKIIWNYYLNPTIFHLLHNYKNNIL